MNDETATTEPGWLAANWPVPSNVHAGTSTRAGGVSTGPWSALNLGDHVDDDPAAVTENRARLTRRLALPAQPFWLRQIHGTTVVDAARCGTRPEADAACTGASGVVCAILTADCLPVLLCDRNGTEVAAAHAGWRGLVGGILTSTLAAMTTSAHDVMAWLGPAIGPAAFEVGSDVRDAFLERNPAHADMFARSGEKYLLDIYAAARLELAVGGVESVYGGGLCTVSKPDCFFSYRRDGTCGRMASLIWLAD